jgi:hypothetical protein
MVASKENLSSVQRRTTISESDLSVIELVRLQGEPTLKTLLTRWVLALSMLFTFTLAAAPRAAEAQVVVKVGPQRHYRHYHHHHYYYRNHHRYYR